MDKKEVLEQSKQELERQRALVKATQKEIVDFLKKNPDKMFTLEEIKEAVRVPESLMAEEKDEHRAVATAISVLYIYKS